MTADKFHWSDPAMTTMTPSPDDPNRLFSMDAAGNRPPRNGLAAVKRARIGRGESDSPEAVLYGDKTGEE
jgi:hypothetical protein